MAEELERVYTEEETKKNAKTFLDPVVPLIVKHLVDENPVNGQKMTNEPITEEFEVMKKKVMEGDKTYLYDCILSQMGQMQQMSLKINMYLGSEKRIDVQMKYASMQMKLMAEQRRTIAALDDLMNPKRTTFVKEVSQHNHFQEKKLDKPSEIVETEMVHEATVQPKS